MEKQAPFDTQLFAELYDQQPQAILWMQPLFSNSGSIIDFEFCYANEEGLHYLNLSREQFRSLKLSDSPTLTEDMRKTVMAEMVQVFETGVRLETTVYNPVLNKYAKIMRTRLRNGVLNVVHDVSEERRIIRQLEEQAIQMQEQKTLLDNILKNSSNGISVSKIIKDDMGRVVDALTIMANDAAVNYIGLPREIYLTKRATEIEPGLIGTPYYQACIRTLETGEPFLMQYLMESSRRWLELTVSKLDNHHLIHVFTDVTAIKEVQLQLERTANTLSSVFNYAQSGMFTFQPELNEAGQIIDFRFVMVNSTLSEYAGVPVEELQGELGVKWFPGYLTNGEFELYKKCFETGEPQRCEIQYHAHGRDYYLDMQCVRVGDQLLVTMNDYSSLRQSQLDLEHTVRALEQSNSYLEDFAHAASHDLKEPLRKIRTFTDRLKTVLSDRLSESEQDLFSRIEVSAERMQLLVDDLLEFSHVSEKPKEMEMVDLNEKMVKVLIDLELAIEEKKATIQLDTLPTVRGNRRHLQQLFQNLISNSLKYSKADVPPAISIRVKKVQGHQRVPSAFSESPYYLFEVEDNGIGFEQQYAEHIFKMFQRLHGRTEYSGTGVGLSIVRKVVENHNGFIWAEGGAGEGAKFSVLLPVP
ncbi:MAG: sensor histidine kinase [Flavisolibacter sp.]